MSRLIDPMALGRIALLGLLVSGCVSSDPAHRAAHDRKKEKARYEEEFRFFEEDYAMRSGRSVSDLTEEEKADARAEFRKETEGR